MGYQFKGTTGEFGDYGYDTAEGWVPYWNLAGEYIGMKFPSYKDNGVADLYRSYPAQVYVESYWDLSKSAIARKVVM